MATNLARQLGALRKQIELPKKFKASLIFNPEEAFRIDTPLIYKLSNIITRLPIIATAYQFAY